MNNSNDNTFRRMDVAIRARGVVLCCLSVALLFTLVLLFSGCESKGKERASREATQLMEEVSGQKDHQRLLTLADSLLKKGVISAGESYYWQGLANYRMGQRPLAEFYWQESINATDASTEPNDLVYYAKSASYLAGMYCRYAEFAMGLQLLLPTVNRLEQLECDTTGDYTNLLIFTGCCKAHFDKNDTTATVLFNRAYQMHLDNIGKNASKDVYHDAVAGLINIAYGWISEGEYKKAQLWTERFGQFVADYKGLYADDAQYIDKQWARYKIFRAIALEGQGRSSEANSDYADYQQTHFSKTMEGMTNASEFLTVARRWNEAVDCYRIINEYLYGANAIYSLENIQRYMLKKYRANLMTGRSDSINAVARQICELLDSAFMHTRRIDASGLQVIHNKDMEILQAETRMARHRQMNVVIGSMLLLIAFAGYSIYRHRVQRRLAEYNAQLEQKNLLLTEANVRAEESARMKTNFIQQISHEIRTPLNILSGFTQIITTPDVELDNDTKQDINHQIKDNTDRITGLVNKMLELSDANSQSVIERTDEVLAIQVAAQAVEDSGISQAAHLAFDLQIAPEAEAVMLHTNLTAATRALTLLLDNAMKFTRPAEAYQANEFVDKKGQAVLRVTADERAVCFVVEDSGIGVPKEEAEHIFEEFVQLDEYYDGTGIGLTVARSLARRLGGDIHLDTDYTGGARFVMELEV